MNINKNDIAVRESPTCSTTSASETGRRLGIGRRPHLG